MSIFCFVLFISQSYLQLWLKWTDFARKDREAALGSFTLMREWKTRFLS